MSNTGSYESWLATEVIAGGLKHSPELQKELVAQFYRWLNSVKAEAWEEAISAYDQAHSWDNLEPWNHLKDNPYRTGED